MPLPFWKQPSDEERLAQLQAALVVFTPVIGGYPPRLASAVEAQQVSQQWFKANELAETLLRRQPTSLAVKVAYGELLRMGHNLHIPNAAHACQHILAEVLQHAPNNAQAHYSLASLYITMNPALAPRAEEHFLQALGAGLPEQTADLYQGLGFACLYQGKREAAIGYFEQCLALQGSIPQIVEIVTHLRAGKMPEIMQFPEHTHAN